jgi:general secretion pathway protein C
MDDLEKNIGIKEIKNGNDLQGFSIAFIRKGSLFEKLGVKRGDVIKAINGETIDSYEAAFNVYKNISNIDNLTLVIERDKEEMELEYEVN